MTKTASRKLIFTAGVFLLSAVFVFSAALASAQEDSITFPVPELGNCGSKEACHAYCDDLAHINQCVAFAEAHGLMSPDEARQAREFARLGGEGPGGCTSKESCEAYCEDPAHMRQCLNFARQAGIMDEAELEEAEKVAEYLEAGGIMPGGCRGLRECRAYCESSDHVEECAEFAIQAGFMSEKEAEIFRKTGGRGPGGCAGRECETYCEDESHREACVAFALEHDLLSEEDKRRMTEGTRQAQEALEKAPPAVLSCIEAALGSETIGRIRAGEGFASPRLGEVLPRCFREVMGDPSTQAGPFGPGSSAQDCMRRVFGEDFEEKMRNGELDPGARDQEIRECMESQMGPGFLNDTGQWERPQMMEYREYREGEDMPPPPLWSEQSQDDANRVFEEKYHQEYEQEFNSRRFEMEKRLRTEIESQMGSGNFDPSKLPPDYRPEGMFPPPESFNRPPEGMHQEGFMPPTGMMPPAGPNQYQYYQSALPNGSMPPPDVRSFQGSNYNTEPMQGGVLPTYFETPPQQTESSGPTSMFNQFLGNVFLAFQNLLNTR